MERMMMAAGVFAAIMTALVSSGNAAAPAQNILINPGFEESAKVDVAKTYEALLAKGADIPKGSEVDWPVGVWLSAGDGWYENAKNVFRYVRGEAGKEVHSGTRAIFLSSTVEAALVCGRGNGPWPRFVPVRAPAEPALNNNMLIAGKPNRFSVWAKGSADISVRFYTYNEKTIIPGKYAVDPAVFLPSEQWQEFSGTVTFGPEVKYVLLVVAVSDGQAVIDDAALYPDPEGK